MTDVNEIPHEGGTGYETCDFQGDITATKPNGVKVPVSFTFTYPKGEGVVLMQIVGQFSEQISGREVLEYLIAVEDESLIAAAATMRDDETDEYDDEDGED